MYNDAIIRNWKREYKLRFGKELTLSDQQIIEINSVWEGLEGRERDECTLSALQEMEEKTT